MRNSSIISYLLVSLMGCSSVIPAGLDDVQSKLNYSDCTFFEFVTTIESKIFDIVDSSNGTAYISADGRYKIEIGPDIYLYDGEDLYSYFWENNQVIIEKPDSSAMIADEISFVMKLTEWYDSQKLKDNKYILRLKREIRGDIPDSMVISINMKDSSITELEYHDINKDLNHIFFMKQEADTTCKANHFVPSFPDSVEKVRL